MNYREIHKNTKNSRKILINALPEIMKNNPINRKQIYDEGVLDKKKQNI